MMTGIFDDLGIRFEYPADWELEVVDSDGERATVLVQSGDGLAFAMITLDSDRPAPAELADEALGAMREEYPNLDARDAIEMLDGQSAVGHDLEFLDPRLPHPAPLDPSLLPVVRPRRRRHRPDNGHAAQVAERDGRVKVRSQCQLIGSESTNSKTTMDFGEPTVQQPLVSFEGKVVTVFINSGAMEFSEQLGWSLVSPRFEEQMGRTFLVGKTIAEYRGGIPWHFGATVNIPWETVHYYLVFDSIEDYHDAAGRYRAEGPKPGWFGRRASS
jgi:hypothetical protein